MGHFGSYVRAEKKSDLFEKLFSSLEGEWDRKETSNGNIDGIVYSDMLFDTEEEAREYLRKEVGDKYYWQGLGFACQFKKYPTITSKKYETLKQRVLDARDKYTKFKAYVPHLDNKSAFISCKTCGAKIPTKLHKSNFCPFCSTDLRSETNLNKLNLYYSNWQKLEKELVELKKSEDMKNCKKAKIFWLAYGEVHF